MRFWVQFSFVFHLLLSYQASAGYSVSWKLKEDVATTVYDRPGFDYFRCLQENKDKPGCKEENKVAYPSNKAKLELVLDKNNRIQSYNKVELHPYRQQMVSDTWYKVKVEYTNKLGVKIKKEGWIEDSYIDVRTEADPRPPTKALSSPEKKKNSVQECPPKSKTSELKGTRDLGDIAHALTEGPLGEHKKNVEAVAQNISNLVGECTYKKPQKGPKEDWVKDEPIYDQEVRPLITAREKELSIASAASQKLTKKSISMDQLIEIDMLARTMYGEMAKCHDDGLQYVEAVAKVAFNRAYFDEAFRNANDGRASEFTNNRKVKIAKDRTPLMKVLSTAYQFNPWDMYLPGKKVTSKNGKKITPLVFNQSGISQALCPPSNSKQYWAGGGVPSQEQKIWKDMLNIATEAVLFPKEFENRTSDVDSLFFQSQMEEGQKMDHFQNRKRVISKIEGESIKDPFCVALYENHPGQQKMLDQAKSKILSK